MGVPAGPRRGRFGLAAKAERSVNDLSTRHAIQRGAGTMAYWANAMQSNWRPGWS